MSASDAEGVTRVTGPGVGGCPELIERDDQLRFLEGLSRRAMAGEAQLVVLTGEAGAGKSRLTREFTRALGRDWRTLFVRIEAGATNPFGEVIGTVPAGEAPAGAIGAAIGRALAARAVDAPLALVIEDLERADPVVVSALAAALDELQHDPVLLLAAFRLGGDPHQRESTGALASVLRAPSAHEVQLESLSRDGVELMASAMGHELDDAEIDALHARGGGNPFFVEELLHSPYERLPWTITEAVLQRLNALPESANEVARALACARDAVARDLIEEVVAEADIGMRLLIDSGIAVAPSIDELSLRHALTGEIVETQLSVTARRDWHRRLAEALERRDDTPAARLTRHWNSAGDAARAARWAVIAGDDAMSSRAYRTAAALYRIALSKPPDDALERAELFERGAVAAGWAGLERESLEWAAAADGLYRSVGERWRAVAMWLNPALLRAPKPPVDLRELADDAVPRLLGEAHDATRRREFAHAVELARRVIEVSDDRSDVGAAWATDAARRLVGAGHLAEGEDVLQRLRASAAVAQDPERLSRTLAALATVAAARGELQDSLRIDRQAIIAALHTETGAWPYEVGTALVLARLADLDEASHLARTHLEGDNPVAREFAQLPACLVDLERGDLDSAWQRLERLQVVYSLGVADFIVGVLVARARWFLLSRRPQQAREALAQANDASGDLFEPSRVELLTLTVRTAATLGDDGLLFDACAALDEVVELGAGRGYQATAAWARGLVRARAGAIDDATALVAAGAEQFEAAGRVVDAAEAWADLAQIAAESGDSATRDPALARAFDLARPRGLRSVMARLEAQEATYRVAIDDATGPLRSLSPREGEIARLVAAGKTNREIASTLFISEHTVRNQLVHIFGKLGISRRTELAGLVAGLEPPRRDPQE